MGKKKQSKKQAALIKAATKSSFPANVFTTYVPTIADFFINSPLIKKTVPVPSDPALGSAWQFLSGLHQRLASATSLYRLMKANEMTLLENITRIYIGEILAKVREIQQTGDYSLIGWLWEYVYLMPAREPEITVKEVDLFGLAKKEIEIIRINSSTLVYYYAYLTARVLHHCLGAEDRVLVGTGGGRLTFHEMPVRDDLFELDFPVDYLLSHVRPEYKHIVPTPDCKRVSNETLKGLPIVNTLSQTRQMLEKALTYTNPFTIDEQGCYVRVVDIPDVKYVDLIADDTDRAHIRFFARVQFSDGFQLVGLRDVQQAINDLEAHWDPNHPEKRIEAFLLWLLVLVYTNLVMPVDITRAPSRRVVRDLPTPERRGRHTASAYKDTRLIYVPRYERDESSGAQVPRSIRRPRNGVVTRHTVRRHIRHGVTMSDDQRQRWEQARFKDATIEEVPPNATFVFSFKRGVGAPREIEYVLKSNIAG